MEITNDNYKILYKNSLKIKDIIRFKYNDKVYEYEVREQYLHSPKGSNGIIFAELELNKYNVATTAYGYLCGDGSWPEYNNQDYKALARLVIFLFEEIEKRENSKAFTKSILSNSIKIKINTEPQIKIELK